MGGGEAGRIWLGVGLGDWGLVGVLSCIGIYLLLSILVYYCCLVCSA